jgi:hypothetical protein
MPAATPLYFVDPPFAFFSASRSEPSIWSDSPVMSTSCQGRDAVRVDDHGSVDVLDVGQQ